MIGEEPIEQFAERLVSEEGMMLLPESVFDHAGNHFRIGMGRSSLAEALCRLERFPRPFCNGLIRRKSECALSELNRDGNSIHVC